jgi:hypothetical protein
LPASKEEKMTDTATPEFTIVKGREARLIRVPRRARRIWGPTLEALIGGQVLFFSDDQLTDQNLKYLMLALGRRGKGERLRTQRTRRNDQDGRDVWAIADAG